VNRTIGSGTLISNTTPIGFKAVHKYIFTPKCLSCHSGPNAEPQEDPIDLSTYESTMIDRFIPLIVKGNPYKGRLYNSLESGEMPPKSRLHVKEIEFIKKWIEACAPKEDLFEIPSECPDDDDDGDDDW
tara:strand:+ start:54456 stop:54842 length:387 start_codon:yes stop_codon:yes gene_type:complete